MSSIPDSDESKSSEPTKLTETKDNTCAYCESVFKSRTSMLQHMRTVRPCIEKQEKEGIKVERKLYKCESCKKDFTSCSSFNYHIDRCKEKIKILYEKEKQEKEKMQEEHKKTEPLYQVQELQKIVDELKKEVNELKKEVNELKIDMNKIKKNVDKKQVAEKKDEQVDETKDEQVAEKDEQVSEKKDEQVAEKDEQVADKKTEKKDTITEYNFGEFIVPIRSDGMVNATALCKAGNKLIGHYLENKNTKEFLQVLELDIGIPISRIMEVNLGGHSGTWVHRKLGYHLAQWISAEFAVRVSNILDELFITGSVILGKEKSDKDIEIMYQKQVDNLNHKLEEQKEESGKALVQQNEKYQKLFFKHTSTLKTHKYIKFKETGPCFYIIEQGIPCECEYNINRKKFGIAGLFKDKEETDTIDNRLKSHRTLWPQLKVNFIIFMKDVDVLEKSFKRFYENEINPNGHEIIEGITTEQMVERIHKFIEIMSITEYKIASDSSIQKYNEYVEATVKE